MVISTTKRFIFVHIYKNAGTSMTSLLSPFAKMTPTERLRQRLGFGQKRDWEALPRHATASEIRASIDSARWNSFFKFAIVRNPWDWQTSLYEFMLKEKTHHQHDLIASMGSFDAYISWRCENEVRLQKDFVCDCEGTVMVDHVARFESIQHEWESIAKRIGVTGSLPHMNASKSRDYRCYYNEATINLVAETFQGDIQMFGYQFD